MKKEKSIPIILFWLFILAILSAACTSQPLDQTPAPTASSPSDQTATEEVEEGTVATATHEPESTSAADEQPPGGSEITAAIVSGDFTGAGKPFTFDATLSQAGDLLIVDYVWDMGDGSTLFGLAVEHVYSEPGLYTVSLTITAEDGRTDTVSKEVEVIPLEELGTPTTEIEDPGAALDGTSWVMNNAMRGTTVTLVFEEGTVSGSSGCNRYNASYATAAVEGPSTSISVGGISVTKKACTAEVMAQEKGYLDSIGSATSYTVDSSTLILETGGGTLYFSQSGN